jgi:hypothetical protein
MRNRNDRGQKQCPWSAGACVPGDGQRRTVDVLRARNVWAIQGSTEHCFAPAFPRREDGTAVVQVQIQAQGTQGRANVRGMADPPPQYPQYLRTRVATELEAWTGGPRNPTRALEQASDRGEADRVIGVRKERRIATVCSDLCIGIKPVLREQPGQTEDWRHAQTAVCGEAELSQAARRRRAAYLQRAHEDPSLRVKRPGTKLARWESWLIAPHLPTGEVCSGAVGYRSVASPSPTGGSASLRLLRIQVAHVSSSACREAQCRGGTSCRCYLKLVRLPPGRSPATTLTSYSRRL